MNPQIELVKKFLDDDKSVSSEELKANKEAVYEAAAAAADEAAYWAAETTSWTIDAEHIEYCKQKAREAIAEYEELTK